MVSCQRVTEAAETESTAEGELVGSAQAGDGEAREELARHCRRMAFVLALQLLGNRQDAMDVAQDAMLRFFSTLHRFDTSRRVRPWLLQIVRNRVRDLKRRARLRQTESLDTAGHDGGSIDAADGAPGPEEISRRRELQRRIWQALSRLAERHREIVVLRDYQDLSYREIADILDIPVGTVMSRLHTARKRLRGELEADLETVRDTRKKP